MRDKTMAHERKASGARRLQAMVRRGSGVGLLIVVLLWPLTTVGQHTLETRVSTEGMRTLHAPSYRLLHTFFAPTPIENDRFGDVVAALGHDVLIGAPFGASVPRVYLFDGTTRALRRTFQSPDPDLVGCFGSAVAAVGSNVLIGDACATEEFGPSSVGAAYLFDGTTGALLHTFPNPTPTEFAQFGISVAGVGSNVLIGANGADAAYLFDGTTGALLHTFQNPIPHHLGGSFGFSVAAVGSDILISAPFATVDNIGGAGAAYLFDGTTWALLHTFVNPTPGEFDNFGWSVAAVGDCPHGHGPDVVIGSNGPNEAYLFDGTTGALLHTLRNPTAVPFDVFGVSVAGVGPNVLIGAPFAVVGGHEAGAAYLFAGRTGTLLHTFPHPTPAAGGLFGAAVAAVGSNVLIGAPGVTVQGKELAGAAYLFDGRRQLVNDLVTFEPLPSTFAFSPEPSACPAGGVGAFSFEARLTNRSTRSLSDLVVEVTALSHGNLLQNADGCPGGVGALLTVPRKDGFSDGVLAPEAFVDVPLVICLQERQPFRLEVDVRGEVE